MSSSIGVQESSTLPRLPMESYLCMFGLSQTIGMTYLVSHTKTQSSFGFATRYYVYCNKEIR